MEDTWREVDEFLTELLVTADAALDAALVDSEAAGLPPIGVTPTQGKFLQLLVRICGARRVLEIGTLGGYSTIWMARGLARGGYLVTLEIERKHAAVAQRNIERAGLSDTVRIRVAPAIETLAEMNREGVEKFDLVFIDADKSSTLEYYEASISLCKPGSLIVIDNVVREGKVIDAETGDANVQGIRRAIMRLGSDPRVSASAIQTVGAKGYDGFILARVT